MIKGYFAVLFVTCNVFATSDKDQNEAINKLEKERNILLNQIHKAIDDSLNYLHKSNDSDAELGVTYIQELKEYMTNVNNTGFGLGNEVLDDDKIDLGNSTELNNGNSTDLRRYRETFFKMYKDKKRGNKNNQLPFQKWETMVNNTLFMKKVIDEFLSKKQAKKDSIKLYKEKQKLARGKTEPCPRFGYKKHKGKKARKDIVDEREIRECDEWIYDANEEKYKECMKNAREIIKTRKNIKPPKSRNEKFPCCRKCCKKSYMGCL